MLESETVEASTSSCVPRMAMNEDCYNMDSNNTGVKEIREKEVTRESLIALSYIEPPKNNATGHSPGNPKDQYVETLNTDVAERCRSELISISYLSSPEAPTPKGLPR